MKDDEIGYIRCQKNKIAMLRWTGEVMAIGAVMYLIFLAGMVYHGEMLRKNMEARGYAQQFDRPTLFNTGEYYAKVIKP